MPRNEQAPVPDTRSARTTARLGLRRNDRVRIRSAAEIRATLDERGELDGLPFMPEMLRYCGTEASVYRVAHKTCDTIDQTGGRSMTGAVHLTGLRCDGSAHGNCHASCLIFWKEAWLERLDAGAAKQPSAADPELARLTAANATAVSKAGTPTRYVCQTTRLKAATRPLAWWNPVQYVRDVRSGNVRPGQALQVLVSAGLRKLMSIGVGYRWVRRFYDRFQQLTGGDPYPFGRGTLPDGSATPTGRLDLAPGERVRIRSKDEILATMTRTNRNRGLYFDVEMVPYCGGEYTVEKRVERIVNEKTGEMIEFNNPCIMLSGVVCRSKFSGCRLLCPRAIPSYWREIWLERVGEPGTRAGALEADRPAADS